jgi:hypothetical protein
VVNNLDDTWSQITVTGTGEGLSRRDETALRILIALLRHPDYRHAPVEDSAHDAVMHTDALLAKLEDEMTHDEEDTPDAP